MKPAFDITAQTYDQEFTDTPLGRAQRNRVWRYMRKVLSKYEHARILELNCGTGEDAVFMAEMGHEVVATDISTEMLKQTRQKAAKAKLQDRIHIKQLDLAVPELEEEAPFDVIFSNFGGLNCLSGEELERLAGFCETKLKPGGVCVFVVMPPKTLLEKVYRWKKGEMEVYHSRNSKEPIMVNVGEGQVPTYFYSPHAIRYLFRALNLEKLQAAGFVPSYFYTSRWIKWLIRIDTLACNLGLMKHRSDHFLIHLGK